MISIYVSAQWKTSLFAERSPADPQALFLTLPTVRFFASRSIRDARRRCKFFIVASRRARPFSNARELQQWVDKELPSASMAGVSMGED